MCNGHECGCEWLEMLAVYVQLRICMTFWMKSNYMNDLKNGVKWLHMVCLGYEGMIVNDCSNDELLWRLKV